MQDNLLQVLPELQHHPQLTQLLLANNSISSLQCMKMGCSSSNSSCGASSSLWANSSIAGSSNSDGASSSSGSNRSIGCCGDVSSILASQAGDGWTTGRQHQQPEQQQQQQCLFHSTWPWRLAVLDISGNQLQELQGLGLCPGLLNFKCERNSLTSIEVGSMASSIRGGTALLIDLMNMLHCFTNMLTSRSMEMIPSMST